MSTIIISEKKKAAQAIAEALGPVQIINHKSLAVFSIPSKNICVIPLRGHIQQYENTVSYQKWTAHDPREIIINHSAIAKIPMDYAKPYISLLQKYAKGSNLCIIGTDADIEGCTIGLIDALPFVLQVNPNIKIEQLWLNDLQKKSIQTAFQNLIPPKWSWAYSGEARALIDAFIGFSATRELSLSLKPILHAINTKVSSIGRVQTSLLYLLYLREVQIRSFIPTPYWTLTAHIFLTEISIITAAHIKNNFNEKSIAEAIYNRIKDTPEAILQDIEQTSQLIQPPTPLNTSEALQLITKYLKITATLALKILEELYLNKIISYPRTESDVYPSTFDHTSLLKAALLHSQYGKYSLQLLKNNKIQPRQGKINAGDHTPITPIQFPEADSSLFENDLHQKVYDLITRHYLALFGDPAETYSKRLLFLIQEEPFTAQNTVLIKPGFYEIAPFLQKEYDPPIILNQKQFRIQKILLTEKKTQPPPRYTDSSLLKLMEQKRLGTKSTRPGIIQILINRQYIEQKQRTFYVKEFGFLLIENLKDVWMSFLDPTFTAHVEEKLEDIQAGKKPKEEIVNQIRQEFLTLFDNFRQMKEKFIEKMKILEDTPRNSLKEQLQSEASLHPNNTDILCPKCKKESMILIITKNNKHFLACSEKSCKTYLSLPQKGKPTLLKTKCNLCQSNVIKMQISKTHYYICPVCWNNALQNHIEGGFCTKCLHYSIKNGKCISK